MINQEMEREANLFACFLLMPTECIREDLKAGYDLRDDDFMKDLQKKYQVPMNALLYRICYFFEHKQ